MQLKIDIQCDALDKIGAALEGIQAQQSAQNEILKELIKTLTPPDASRIIFFVEQDGELKRVGGTMFQKVTETKKFKIKATDRFGNDAKIDGAAQFSLTDESLATVEVSEDGMSASVVPKGAIGSAKLQVKADADLGEGVKELLGELQLDFVAGDAEVIAISEEVEAAPVEEAPVEEAPVEEAPVEEAPASEA